MELSTSYWKEAAQACQKELLSDLKPLIAIESVRDDSLATPQAPFGPGPAAALQYCSIWLPKTALTPKT